MVGGIIFRACVVLARLIRRSFITQADMAWGEFGFRRLTDSQKQGKSGTDIPASPEALSSRMRDGGNGIDGLESPPRFAN